jgi:hypothetical protein
MIVGSARALGVAPALGDPDEERSSRERPRSPTKLAEA